MPVAERYVPVSVPAGPGPAKYGRVFVEKLLPPGRPATSVLVLVPGTDGSAGGILPPAMRVTNEAMFGYAFDESTSPESLSIIHTHA